MAIDTYLKASTLSNSTVLCNVPKPIGPVCACRLAPTIQVTAHGTLNHPLVDDTLMQKH
jgi:hypothetical protein